MKYINKLSIKLRLVLTFIIILCFFTSAILAQIAGNQRGLYVDQFVDLFHNNNPNGPNNSINTSYCILSNTTAENNLLQYCMENHIT